jgi:uncharacterized protein (DUF2147 family)
MTTTIRVALWSLFLFAALLPITSRADAVLSPIGLWKTIDDATGNVGALVRIYEKEGKLFGRIEKLFKAGAESQVCTACKDDRKSQPIIGLLIIRNIEREEEGYGRGDILDPDSGSVYRCKMHLEEHGTRLIVRGYIGFSFIGRSQTWQRQTWPIARLNISTSALFMHRHRLALRLRARSGLIAM